MSLFTIPSMNKSRIAILAPYPLGQAPSQRFRFEQYIEELEKAGFQVDFHPFLHQRTWEKLYQTGTFTSKASGIIGSFLRRFALLFTLHRYSHIFIHREAAMIGPPVFEWIISKVLRRKYIYDFDDAIWLPNYSESNARFHRLKAYWKVKKVIRWADQVSAGNAYLRDYALQFNPNVTIIPTTVDMINVHNQQTDYDAEPVVIGWTGTHTTMAYLNYLEPLFQKLEKRYPFQFLVISNQAPDLQLASLRYLPWNKTTEIDDLAKIQIGIMPLEPTPWSEGKCGFKGLQYMALGIPAVLSPVGVNKEIIHHGVNGFLCDSLDEWENVLVQLIENAELRKTIGQKGKESVKKHYSTQALRTNYLNLFK